MDVHPDLDSAAQILAEERDYNLNLHAEAWGSGLPSRWTPKPKPALHFTRTVPVHLDDEGATCVEESIVPFPSAPIYGINRKAEYGKSLAGRPNMHSVRLLKRPDGPPINRLFILHNGLNEADSLKFYYQLSDWIFRQQEVLAEDEGAACLVAPFPGHLMHSSFHGPFSETPLARYLTDAGDLFRQFLKYMIGMGWLLSIVADSDASKWMVGGDLLDPEERPEKLIKESTSLYEMSMKRIANAAKVGRAEDNGETASTDLVDIGEMTSVDQVKAVETLLRTTLGRDSDDTPESLKVHVVGYSLGGFVAQSVFFAWPQVVSSCTTICSGGAISALSPTAFAQPEEWQSVLHALRPEMINSMLQGRLGDDERNEDGAFRPVGTVAGMPLKSYGYFQRIFEQVFLQEDRGSYKERLSEYSLRMLFVSGGEDPIVPPANILDASPREGTTMLSVAGMTHFLNQDPKDDEDRREAEQREFWLPEAGGLIARAAVQAEKVHMGERKEAARLKAKRKRPPGGQRSEPLELLSNGYMFETALDKVLEAVEEDGGWLLICRNALPAAFLPTEAFTTWGTGLHHHDLRIQRYTLGLRHRAAMLRKIKPRTTLILPEQIRHWFVNLSARFEPHSDAPGGRMTTKSDRTRIWRKFEKSWWPTVRLFEAGSICDPLEGSAVDAGGFSDALTEWIPTEHRYLEATHLPDVWIGIQPGSELVPTRAGKRDGIHQDLVDGIADVLGDLVKLRDAPPGKKPQTPAMKLLENELAHERIRIVQISAAEFNPRYRGRIDRGSSAATRLLARTAAGLVRSEQIPAPARQGAANGAPR